MKPRHTKNDLWLEFGVASGNTINYISKNTTNIVYGFDSFEGLPEKWRDGFDKGVFSRGGNLPKVNKNVVLIKGWFDKTLPEFMNKHKKKKITFIHIDCDLYSSTKTIFNLVKNNLDKNCIIVFDELINYPGYTGDKGELKAWYEFITKNKIKYKFIGYHGEKVGLQLK